MFIAPAGTSFPIISHLRIVLSSASRDSELHDEAEENAAPPQHKDSVKTGASADSLGQLRLVLWTEPLVICGFGDVGSTVARAALVKGRHPHQVTVVEQDAARARRAEACGHRIINSDARLVPILRSAGAGVAATIIICLRDEDVVEAIHAARSVAPNASIQVVLNGSGDERAATAAGANAVLSLSRIAARLLADAALGGSPDNDTTESG